MKRALSLALALLLSLALVIPVCASDSFHKVTVYASTYYSGVFTISFSKAKIEIKNIVLYDYDYGEIGPDGPKLEKWTAKNVPVITLANDTDISCLQNGIPVDSDGDYPEFGGYTIKSEEIITADPLVVDIFDGQSLEWIFPSSMGISMDMIAVPYRVSDQETNVCYIVREGSSMPSGAFSAASSEAPGVSNDRTVVGVGEETTSYTVVGAEEKTPAYTGPCPDFYGILMHDAGLGYCGNVYNSTNETVSGRWGIITCAKTADGYVPIDVEILEYSVGAYGTVYVTCMTQSSLGLSYHLGDYYSYRDVVHGNHKLVRVNLNKDADYEQFVSEVCALNTIDKSSYPENYYYFADNSEATSWLRTNFGALLK